MTEAPQEALVIIEGADVGAVLDELRAVATVTQRLPPRLALVVPVPAPAASGPGRRAHGPGPGPDVAGLAWFDDEVPDEVLDRLTEPERLFVAAWRSRRTPKRRQADGRPWDAPGGLPPDRP